MKLVLALLLLTTSEGSRMSYFLRKEALPVVAVGGLRMRPKGTTAVSTYVPVTITTTASPPGPDFDQFANEIFFRIMF